MRIFAYIISIFFITSCGVPRDITKTKNCDELLQFLRKNVVHDAYAKFHLHEKCKSTIPEIFYFFEKLQFCDDVPVSELDFLFKHHLHSSISIFPKKKDLLIFGNREGVLSFSFYKSPKLKVKNGGIQQHEQQVYKKYSIRFHSE